MFSVHDTTIGPLSSVTLRDAVAGSHATIVPARGAITTSFFARGREQLYLDEATLLDPSQNVRGGVPVLFPSPGRLKGDAYTHEGVTRSMKQHGFARNLAFTEVERGAAEEAWVTLDLVPSEITQAQYPFAFRLRLRLSLAASTLAIRAEVRNDGVVPLPFALGYHPYFAVGVADKAATRIPTKATRAWDNVAKQEVALHGIVLGSAPGSGSPEREVDLHLLDHGARHASLESAQGEVELRGDFDRWVVWTVPGKDFVCLEPWTAPADALRSGEGLTTLDPGSAATLRLEIAVR